MAYLAERGRKRVAFLVDQPTPSSRLKQLGYEDGAARAGMRALTIGGVEGSVEGGYAAAKALLAGHPDVDGLICSLDIIACGAMRAIADSGRRVPQDVAVIGTDNSVYCDICTPRLTSLNTMVFESGVAIAHKLVDCLEGRSTNKKTMLFTGLVFMILFKKTPYTDGLANLVISWFGGEAIDFIDGPYWAKMFVLCVYTIWVVMPFKILILTSALASVDEVYYNAARVDGTSKWRTFARITLPMISPTVFYLIITGFIGAFKAYSDAVALFGTDLNASGMNTIVGYVYDMLYGNSGGYPSYASAAAIILFAVVLTITCINLLISTKHVHYS